MSSQTNNFLFTDSKKGKQMMLRYLYQLGGLTGPFDILNKKNLYLTTTKKLTDSQRQKRNQKKKNN